MISDYAPFDSDGLGGTERDAARSGDEAFDPNRIAARTPGRWRVGP